MKKGFFAKTIYLLTFFTVFVNAGYSQKSRLHKIEIAGRDTSACLKKFPSKYPLPVKKFQSQGYFSLDYKIDSFSITQYFTPDSQILCQKCLINDRLLFVIAVSRNGILVPEINLVCGNGKIRDYNWIFNHEGWGGLFAYNILSVTDFYYQNGLLTTRVEFEMHGNDTIKLERYENGKLNGWSRYFYHGKISYQRLYENGTQSKLVFIGDAVCEKDDLAFESVSNTYSLKGKICNGKISVFITMGFYNGTLDRELFFTNGKIDSVIVYHSSQWAVIFRVVVDYSKRKWTVYQYYPNGSLNWINNCIFELVPEEKNKAFDFPDRGSSIKLNGASWDYYLGGKIKTEYNFKDGLRDGKSVFYDKSGNITRIINYKDDKIISDN
ncbi:MAG: hypothetical protein M3R17_00730 [Bacteroidota bacterium]|nr:hypothetical protein [Bacteroidota bacterium]